MSLADWIDWMADDITFCFAEDCTYVKCRRHPENIRDKTVPHSYMMKQDVPDCPLRDVEIEVSPLTEDDLDEELSDRMKKYGWIKDEEK